MPDFRCYCEHTPSTDNARITLSPEESNHLIAANRARTGDPVRLFNGQGIEWDAVVVTANKRKTELEIRQRHPFDAPRTRIALAQAIPKGKLLDSIIRRATEIGIQEIIPLISQRVETKIDPKKSGSKNAKWTAAAIEGAKQSGNPFLVEVHPAMDLNGLMSATADAFELKLVASLLPDTPDIKRRLRDFRSHSDDQNPRSILWLVGPEGDFTPEESAELVDAGFQTVSLGAHVMRCETAAIAAMAISRYELGS